MENFEFLELSEEADEFERQFYLLTKNTLEVDSDLRKAREECSVLKKRLKDLRENQESGEVKELEQSIKEKDFAISTLKAKLEGLYERAKVATKKELCQVQKECSVLRFFDG